MMIMAKRLVVVLLALAFVSFSFKPAQAEDAMQSTFISAGYGGLIGALVGAGVWMISDNDEWDDHISYIPTGAGVGILAGTAYGLYTHMAVRNAAAEVRDGRLTFNVPAVKTTNAYDTYTNRNEVVESLDLLSVKF
mgnify:CR=1 FL=1